MVLRMSHCTAPLAAIVYEEPLTSACPTKPCMTPASTSTFRRALLYSCGRSCVSFASFYADDSVKASPLCPQ